MLSDAEIKLVSNGNAEAGAFLRVFIARAHLLDDVIDRDELLTDERLAEGEVDWLLQLTGNAWFLAHRAMLVPLIVQAMNAWVDSNRWCARPQKTERIAADVLKGFYHEVLFHVAFLTGGWTHLRKVTTTGREYDFETRPEEGPL